MKTSHHHFSIKYHGGWPVILSAFALGTGAIIYIFFRPAEHVFFDWIRAVGLSHWFNLARESSLSSSLMVPEWFVYSLPNGLWAFAYALLITLIWGKSKSWLRYLWMASIPFLVLGYEILQYVSIIPGTFSKQDILFGMAGLIIGNFVGVKLIKPDNHEKAIE